ncbi:facilitated trehalose transporter Tret1 isoform X2 [Halictus rubicundus]
MTETEVTDKVAEVIDGETQSDVKKEDKIAIYPQIIASVVAYLTLLAAGLCYAWPTVTLDYYRNPKSTIKMTSVQESWMVTAMPLGALIGPIGSALLVDRVGRKWFLFAICLPFVAGWILLYLARTWVFLFIGRLFSGMPTGALCSVVPLYVGEIVETKIRGAANMLFIIFLNTGYIIVYAIGPWVDPKILALICLVPTFLILLWIPWLPESPYYCLKKNNEKGANLSLIWLRRNTNNTKTIEEMSEFMELEKNGGLKELLTKPVHRKALYITLLLIGGQQLSGTMAINSYAGVLIGHMHPILTTQLVLVILGVISVVSGIATALIIDRIGRKPLFLISAYMCSICLALIGTYFLLGNLRFNMKPYNLVPVVSLILYYVTFSIGLGSIPAVVCSEIFPLGVKMWASALTNTVGALLGLIVSKCYQPIVDAAREETIFYIFCAVELIIATTAIFIMPETSKKSFLQIQNELMSTTKRDIKEEESTETKEELA